MAQADTLRKALYEQFARMGKAFAHPNRLELLELLAQAERSVESLARTANLTVANTSQHLQQLRQVGLITSRKAGLHVYYQLADASVLSLLAAVREIAVKHLAEVDELVNAAVTVDDELEALSIDELLRRLKEKRVTVVDVRPAEEFVAGHLPDAVNLPLENLEQGMHRLPTDREVVVYCRGPYCLWVSETVARLREKGFKARRLKDGYPEWKMTGFPVSGGS